MGKPIDTLEEILGEYYQARDTAYKVPCPHNGKCNKLGCPNKEAWEKGRQANIKKATNQAKQAIKELFLTSKGGDTSLQEQITELLSPLSSQLFKAAHDIYVYRDTKDWHDEILGDAEGDVNDVAQEAVETVIAGVEK